MQDRQRTQVLVWAAVPFIGLAALLFILIGRGLLFILLPVIFIAFLGVMYFIFQGRTRNPDDMDTH
jgi:hypothetical protein